MSRLFPIILIVASAGCRPQPVRPPNLATLPTATEAMARLQSGPNARHTMRTLGRVTYFGDKGRIRLRTVMVAERPGKFRVETLSPLEQPIDVMTSDGQRLWLLSGGKLYEGPATPENIARVVPAPLRPEDLVDALLGGIPTGGRYAPKKIAWADDDHEDWALTLDAPGGETAELRVDPVQNVVEKLTMRRADGVARMEVEFDDFKAIESGGVFWRKLKITIPEQNHEVTMKLNEVDVNVPLDGALFELKAPDGVMALPLDSPPAAVPDR